MDNAELDSQAPPTDPGLAFTRWDDPVSRFEFAGGGYLMNGYEALMDAARTPELFSSEHDIDGTRRQYERDGELHSYGGAGIPEFPVRLGIIDMDPPEHTPYRRLMAPLFSPPAVERAAPRVRELVTECIDAFIENGRFDVMEDLASPLTAFVTMEGLGLSPKQAKKYSNVMHVIASDVTGPVRDQAEVQLGEMLSEMVTVAKERREDPKGDWLSCFATAEINGELMSDAMLQEMAMIIVAGGVETTTMLIASTLLHLNRNPDDRARLMSEPDLLTSACEEMLRVYSPVIMQGRTVTTETTVEGVSMTEGDRVGLCFSAANRDPAIFEEPHHVKLDRPNNRHVAFGAGVHRCIGANLGRLMFTITIEQILERLPDFAIDEATIVYRDSVSIGGYESMPATFTPGMRRAPVRT